MRFVAVLSFLCLAAFSNARAEEQTQTLGSFRDWSAYSFSEQGHKVCFMATKPTRSLPAGARRGDVYAQVTHRPHDNSNGVFSVVTGYTYKANSEAVLTIGDKKFQLMTQGDTAWARDEATDRAIAAAIKNGNTMTVEGTSSRGTKTTDTYSLSGSSAAFQAINRACGVN
jgi:hypothetical protein